MMRTKKEIKDSLIALKITSSLMASIDREAEAEGLTRGAIVRRILLAKYKKKAA